MLAAASGLVWPPSRETAPALLSIVVVLLTSFYILFVRKTQSKEEKKVLEKKLRTVYALMDTQIKQAKKREEAKRKEEAEKNGDKKRGPEEEGCRRR